MLCARDSGLPGAKHCHSVGRNVWRKGGSFSVHEHRITHLRCDFLRSGDCLMLAHWNCCVSDRRTQPLICVGFSVHYWVPCATNNGGFFEIAFVVVLDTHLPRFEALAYVSPHFDELTHVVIRASSSVC